MELPAHSHTAREGQDAGKRSGLGSTLSREVTWHGGGLTGQGCQTWGTRLGTWNISEVPYLKGLCVHAQSCPIRCDLMDCSPLGSSPLPMGFPKQEYWSESPFPPPGMFPTQRNLCLLRWHVGSLPLSHQGSPFK